MAPWGGRRPQPRGPTAGAAQSTELGALTRVTSLEGVEKDIVLVLVLGLQFCLWTTVFTRCPGGGGAGLAVTLTPRLRPRSSNAPDGTPGRCPL